LGVRMLSDGRGRTQSMVQMRLLETDSGVWAAAARTAGWQEILVYTLPRCPARLALAYSNSAPRMPAYVVHLALRMVANAVRVGMVQAQAETLRERVDTLNYLVTAGNNFVNEGIVQLDNKGRIVLCNTYAAKLLGYAADEVIGLPANGLLASRSDIAPLVERVLTACNAHEEHQLTLFHRYGEPIPVNLRILSLCLSGESAPFGAAVAFVDRRSKPMEAVEKSLQEKNAQLESMISVLSHEIRNPLGSIKAGLDYLEPVLSHDPEAREDLETIQVEILRLDRLLKDALLVSRSSELQLVMQDITDVLDQLLAGRKKLFAEQGITIRRKFQPNLPQVPIDRMQMEQVFDNLIVNAIHAMADGGYLTLTAETGFTQTGNLNRRRPVLKVKVGDSGSGIPPEMQKRIFDPFFTTKKGGTGLGLSVARRIISQHNGALLVESWPEAGTIFTIILPVEEGLID